MKKALPFLALIAVGGTVLAAVEALRVSQPHTVRREPELIQRDQGAGRPDTKKNRAMAATLRASVARSAAY